MAETSKSCPENLHTLVFFLVHSLLPKDNLFKNIFNPLKLNLISWTNSFRL